MGQRLLAYLVDLAAVLAVGGAGLVLGGWVLAVVLALEVAVVTVAVEARRGVTLGKLATGTRSTRAGETLAPGLRREVVRAGIFGAAHLLAGLGQVAMLALAGRGRAFHDTVARTEVVSLRVRATPEIRPVRPAAPVPAIPNAPAGAMPSPWPAAASPGSPAAGDRGWRPPELLEVPVSSDSISMRDFRALKGALVPPASLPATPGRPSASTPIPPRPAASTPVPPRPAASPAIPPRPVSPAIPPRPTAQPAAAPPASAPAAGGFAPSEPAGAVVTEVVLTVRGGESHRIRGSAVVGRRPRSEDPAVQVVEIPDTARSLSRTHARIRVAHGVAWVEDAGSANGSSLRLPDGSAQRLVPGEPARLVPGVVLELGRTSLDVQLS